MLIRVDLLLKPQNTACPCILRKKLLSLKPFSIDVKNKGG